MFLTWVIVALVLAFLALWFWPRDDFTIALREGRVECSGKLRPGQEQAIAEFLLREFPNRESFKIMGSWSGARLRLRFRGSLSEGERQRVRNFLLSLPLKAPTLHARGA